MTAAYHYDMHFTHLLMSRQRADLPCGRRIKAIIVSLARCGAYLKSLTMYRRYCHRRRFALSATTLMTTELLLLMMMLMMLAVMVSSSSAQYDDPFSAIELPTG